MCASILRGAFCVLPSPPLPPSPTSGRGGYGVRKRSFRPTLKLTLQHSIGSAHCVGEGLGARAKQHAPSRTQARGIWSAEAKLPPDAEGAACRAPTPLSHKVGEGLGVRAKQHAPSRTQARGIWSAEAKLPLDAEANASALHRVGALRGRGVRDEGKTTRPPLPQGGRGAGGEGKTACAPTITPRGWWCASRGAGTHSARD
jgi:hypothetical protein